MSNDYMSLSVIHIHAGTETNNYIITGWVDNKEIIASTNISVHVFPYEIDTPDQIVRSHSVKSAPISVETLPEYDSHLWKLNAIGSNSELARIGATTDNIEKIGLKSSQVYFKSNKAGEKYNLTATHELYTNVTDTVEFRTCDIFFNPISCESVGNGYVLNPRGFVYNDETHYKLEVEPKSFLYNSVVWEGTIPLLVTPRDEKNLYVGLNTAQGSGEYFDNEITIQIPDYYESPPKFTVRVFNGYKIIKIKPIVIKYEKDKYINHLETSRNPTNYVWYSKEDFKSTCLGKVANGFSYANKIYRQAGIKFQVDAAIEKESRDFFFYKTSSNSALKNLNSTYYDGINVYIVDSFEAGSGNGDAANAYTIHTNEEPRQYFGVIVNKYTLKDSYPHEFGHMLGLYDIYALEDIELALSTVTEEELPNDFTGGENYYNQSKNLANIIQSLLMYGSVNTSGDDIQILSLGDIFGSKTKENHSPTGLISVGLEDINTSVITYGEIINEN